MTSLNTKRFSIAKDIKDYIEIVGQPPWGDLSGSDERTWKYEYLGDPDFLSFMNIYTPEIDGFSKYYPDMDIWMKNIHWDSLFRGIKPLIRSLLERKGSDGNLSIIHLYPLEMVIIGETLKSLGIVNIVYNFNRLPAVNSISKTLEAGLFLVSWKQIDWLQSQMEKLRDDVLTLTPNSGGEGRYFLFDENDTPPAWNIAKLDPYVKGAIGYKENAIIYRLGEIPEKEFLISKNIKTITFYDTDSSNAIDTHIMNTLGDIFHYENEHLEYKAPLSIGYFEDYVVEKNQEYLIYKKTILHDTEATRMTLEGSGGMEKKQGRGTRVVTNDTDYSYTKSEKLSVKEALAYLGGLSLLLPIFLMLEVGGGQPIFSRTSSGWGGGSSSYRGGSSFSNPSSYGGSFSKSSSISSFGGGGFSKGGG